MEVYRRFGLQTRTPVYFEDPGVQVIIEQYVVAEEFEEVAFCRIRIGLHFLSSVEQVLLDRDKALQNSIVDLRPHQFYVDAHFCEMVLEGREGPLIADVLLMRILIFHERIVRLIQAVVG